MLDSTVKHLNLACSVISRQRQETRALQAALSASENHTGELYWKISDFKARLADGRLGGGKVVGSSGGGQELVSAPFYTGPCGYKLVASVFPNGNGSGEGRYLSVYIKVLPGDYDHVLEWPFAIGLTFTLYDQCPRVGRVNISESFVPDPTWKHFQKPARDAAAGELPLGFGYPRFASHDELRTRNYVRDDSILIYIRAATAAAPPR